MAYKSLRECVEDLESAGQLIRIKEEVDPNLEMAVIHRRIFEHGGPAVLFERVKGTKFPAVSNLYGSKQRYRYLFRQQFELVEAAIKLKSDPGKFLQYLKTNWYRKPMNFLKLPFTGLSSLPKKIPFSRSKLSQICSIGDLPQIVCWPDDGGAFITLPQVFSQSPTDGSLLKANLGMYRVQLSGNSYVPNKEIGLHYQIHRGIGIHHSQALQEGVDLPVTIFVGGPPSHAVGAVMPMPESLSELLMMGMLGGRRFRYTHVGEHVLSADADFCITAWLRGKKTKPEGPFGDHLGYYSLKHDFPYLEVDKVYHRKDAIWPFTVVGRPPQEDSSFGSLIHELTKGAVQSEIPGVDSIHAVDEAGVHPLLLAIGHERYVPYKTLEPKELLTQANAILGFNQCSLAKYLFIAAREDDSKLSCTDVPKFFDHILSRVDWRRDLHFQTSTTIDTLDYSGTSLNQGSKLVVAACGPKNRRLSTSLPTNFSLPSGFSKPQFVQRGILAIQANAFTSYKEEQLNISRLCQSLESFSMEEIPLIVVVDDSTFSAKNFSNFLWLTFTRSNPSHDTYGLRSYINHKHWACEGSFLIDARSKPFHAPPLEDCPRAKKRVDQIFARNSELMRIVQM